MPPVAPMLAKLARELPVGRACCTSPSGTGSAASCSGTATRWSWAAATSVPSRGTSPSSSSRSGATSRRVPSSTARSSSPGRAGWTSTPCCSASIPPRPAWRCWPSPPRPRSWPSTSSPSTNATCATSPFAVRRSLLEQALAASARADPPHPVHHRPRRGRRTGSAASRARGSTAWWRSAPDLAYREGERVMVKVKHERTADCVVAGFRWHKSGGVVGSLLLGLYDDDGVLHHVGVTASFTAAPTPGAGGRTRPRYRLSTARGPPVGGVGAGRARRRRGRTPAGRTVTLERRQGPRLGAPRTRAWCARWPTTTCKGDRFRHATTFRRWRPDRRPRVLHLRPARGGRARGARVGVRSMSSGRRVRAASALRLSTRRALLGATRWGSPRCLAKWGGQGASPRPSASSRSASSSRGPGRGARRRCPRPGHHAVGEASRARWRWSGRRAPRRAPRPTRAGTTPGPRDWPGPSRPTPRCGPGRSGCSRRRHARPRCSFHHAEVAMSGMPALQLPCQGQRGPADLGEAPSGLDGDVHVDAPRPRRLGEPDQAVLLEHGTGLEGHPRTASKGTPGWGSRSIRSSSGWSASVAPDRPRVQVETSQVGGPQRCGPRRPGTAPPRCARSGSVTVTVSIHGGGRPGPASGRRRALGAVGVALEHGGPLTYAPQRRRGPPRR